MSANMSNRPCEQGGGEGYRGQKPWQRMQLVTLDAAALSLELLEYSLPCACIKNFAVKNFILTGHFSEFFLN